MANQKDEESIELIFRVLQKHENRFEAMEKRLEEIAEKFGRISSRTAEPLQRPESHHSIMIVDDDPSVVKTFRMILENAGYTVDTASNAVGAIRKASRIHFDLVIVDINLPDTLGDILAERLIEVNKNLRIIMITGYSSYKEQIERNEKIEVMMKPINPDSLLAAARKTLQKAKKSAPILQQGKIKGSRKGMQTDYGTAKMMPQLQTAVSLINKKLNELVANLSENEENKFKEDPDFRAKLREKAQTAGTKTAINNPEGNPDYDKVIRKAAENEAYELLHAVKLSRRGVKSDDKAVAIPIVGSSLFAESLYKYALVVEDEQTGEKKTGFKNVDEIGGFTKQTTAFRIKLTRDAKLGDARNLQDFDKDTQVECEFVGDPERAKLFEGKKVYLDWNIVRELAKAAEERFKKEGLVKKSIFAENQQAE